MKTSVYRLSGNRALARCLLYIHTIPLAAICKTYVSRALQVGITLRAMCWIGLNHYPVHTNIHQTIVAAFSIA